LGIGGEKKKWGGESRDQGGPSSPGEKKSVALAPEGVCERAYWGKKASAVVGKNKGSIQRRRRRERFSGGDVFVHFRPASNREEKERGL